MSINAINQAAKRRIEAAGYTIVDRGGPTTRPGVRRWGLIDPNGDECHTTFENLRVARSFVEARKAEFA